jgi:uncharacterized protein YukE
VDLPGRPSGNAHHLRDGGRAWEHLAWEIWNLTRQVEQRVDALLQGWSGPAADAFAARWTEMRGGFAEFDHRLHAVAFRLRGIADVIEDAQSTYDRALAAAGIATAAGIGLTVFTLGVSDVLAEGADAALAANVVAFLARLEVTLARLGMMLAELAQMLDGLASRFAVNFAIRAPELASSPLGGGAISTGLALASGIRNPADLAATGLLGAVESGVGSRRGANAEGEVAEEGAARPLPRSPLAQDAREEAWRRSLPPAWATKQAKFDSATAFHGTATEYASIKDELTARTVRSIEALSPNSVRYIDRPIVNHDSPHLDALTDIDIETETAVIQVKSGGTRDLSKQLVKTASVTGKRVLALAPNMTDSRLAWYRDHGYTVARSIEELLHLLGGAGAR